MARIQALPFVCISTNQFKTLPLPVHLTGGLTLVVNTHYDRVGANFIHLTYALHLDYNTVELFHDLGSMQREFRQGEVNEHSL